MNNYTKNTKSAQQIQTINKTQDKKKEKRIPTGYKLTKDLTFSQTEEIINNINKLKPGEILTNYQELTNKLNLDNQAGDTRKKQEDILSNFISYSYIKGKKLLIDNIFIDNLNPDYLFLLTRGESKSPIWFKLLGSTVLEYLKPYSLAQEKLGYKSTSAFFLTEDLITSLGFANINFNLLKTASIGVNLIFDDEEQIITRPKTFSTFLSLAQEQTKNVSTRAVETKTKLDAISYIYQHYWVFVNTKLQTILTNLNNNKFISYRYGYSFNISNSKSLNSPTNYRHANLKEEALINDITYKLAIKLNKDIKSLFFSPYSRDFYNTRNNLVKEELGYIPVKGHCLAFTSGLLDIGLKHTKPEQSLIKRLEQINYNARTEFVKQLDRKSFKVEERELIRILDKILDIESKKLVIEICKDKEGTFIEILEDEIRKEITNNNSIIV